MAKEPEPTRYLRNTFNGQIYEWHPQLAAHKNCVEVTEVEAYPSRFQPESQKGRKSKIEALVTDDEVTAATEPSKKRPELNAEASVNLPGSKPAPKGKK